MRWRTLLHPHGMHGLEVPHGLQAEWRYGSDNRGQLSLRASCPLRLGFWYIPCPKEVLRGMKPCYQGPRDELQTHGQLKSNSFKLDA